MPVILHHAAIQCLVSVRGHPFDRSAFDVLFQGMEGISATMVDQPAAALLMNPAAMQRFDLLVLYDMPGLDFAHGAPPPALLEPDEALKAGFTSLLESGKPLLALHHALAGWPAWEEYGAWLGGRFLYHPSVVRGVAMPDSGYRHDVHYEAMVLGDHPVTRGLPQRFAMTDELYLCPVFAEGVTPLLASSASFIAENFWSATRAVQGHLHDRTGWHHPQGSNLIGWSKRAINSPLVYLQPGDGPSAYNNPCYRQLVENAIRWLVTGQ